MLPAFQTRRLAGYGAVVVNETEALVTQLTAKALPGGPVTLDLDAVMARLTLNVAVRTLFGAPPPENGTEVEAAQVILSETAFAESTTPLNLPDSLPLVTKRAKRQAIRVMDELVSGLVTARLAEAALQDRQDLLSILVYEHGGEFKAIRDDSMSLLIAGHETSGALLTWVFACLANNPGWLATVHQELVDVLGNRAPLVADLRALPVLCAVIDETLRLYPPAYSLFLRQAIQAVEIGGQRLRLGDLVQILPYSTQRDPRFFTDPAVFKPGRFLSDPAWPQYAYLPFGAGPRVCIGQNFGLIEACLIVATLLQRMKPEPITDIPAPKPRFSLRPKTEVMMRWRFL